MLQKLSLISKQPENYSVTTSKGNQLKYLNYDTNEYIKSDLYGYEGLSEVICSRLLEISTCDNFVVYREYAANCCASANFLEKSEKAISIYRLFQHNGIDIEKEMKNLSIKDKIVHLTNLVEDLTDISGYLNYLASVLKFDYLTMNDDRHLNNIGVIYNNLTDSFRLMPVFDNGGALLSDISKYPLYNSINDNIKLVVSKPFSSKPKKQFEACCDLTDVCFKIDYNRLENVFHYKALFYDELVVSRCFTLLDNRLRLLQSYFQL